MTEGRKQKAEAGIPCMRDIPSPIMEDGGWKSEVGNKTGRLAPQNWQLEMVPPGVYFEITKRCNLSCKYCYARQKNQRPDPLNTQEVLAVIKNIKNAGNTFIIISGGEPLIREDIFKILDFAVKNHPTNSETSGDPSLFPVSLVTNATLITPDIARKLAAYPSLQIRISLDGPDAEYHDPIRGEGSFRKTMTGIKNLLKTGMRKQISLCSTVSSLNVKVMGEMVKKTVGMGINSLVITPVVRQGGAGETWEELRISPSDLKNMFDEIHELEEKFAGRIHISGSMKSSLLKSLQEASNRVKCPVGQRVAIDASGGVFPCSLMMLPEFLCGNVMEEPLEEILTCNKMKNFKDCALHRKEKIPQCFCCPWKDTCTGGCMARAYMETGELLSADPDCGVIGEILRDEKKSTGI